MSVASGPAYFDRLIDAWHAGQCGRFAHLGHWDVPPPDEPARVSQEDFASAQMRLTRQLTDRARLRSGLRVLDVGCGFGGLLEAVDRQITGAALTGVNIDWQQLEICQSLRSQSGNTFRWQEADACHLPFADSCFDVVFCVEAMFHFSSRRAFLEEAWRCLTDGGRLVLSDFVVTADESLPGVAIAAVLQDGYGPWPDPWCTAGDAAGMLRAGRWTQIETTDATALTLPSYRYVAPRGGSEQSGISSDPGTRAVQLLQWLQQRGHLRYEYLSAVKGAS